MACVKSVCVQLVVYSHVVLDCSVEGASENNS